MNNNKSISNMSNYLNTFLNKDLGNSLIQDELFNFFKEEVVKEVNNFFNKDWNTIKSELLNYYKDKPVNTYKAIRRLLMFLTYRFNIESGKEEERLNDLFNGFKEGIKELLTDKYIFNQTMGFIKEEVMLKTRNDDIYSKLPNIAFLREYIKNYETRINFHQIKDAWLLNNNPDSTESNPYIIDISGIKYTDIEKIIDKIKPVFEFIKNKKLNIIGCLPNNKHSGPRSYNRGIIEFTNETMINKLTTLLINRNNKINYEELKGLRIELMNKLRNNESEINDDNIYRITNEYINNLKEEIKNIESKTRLSNKDKRVLKVKKDKLRKLDIFKKTSYPNSSIEYGIVNFYLELGNMIELLKKPSPEQELETLIRKGKDELRNKGFDEDLINNLMREGVRYLERIINGNSIEENPDDFTEDNTTIRMDSNNRLYNELFPYNELLGKRIITKNKISSREYNKQVLEEVINSIINDEVFSNVKDYDYYKNLESRLEEDDWEFTPDELIDLATIRAIRESLSIYDERIVEDVLKKMNHLPPINAPIINELRIFIKQYNKEIKKNQKEVNINTFLISPEAFIKEDYEKAYIILGRIKKMLNDKKVTTPSELNFIQEDKVLLPNALLNDKEKEIIQLIEYYNKNKDLEINDKKLHEKVREVFNDYKVIEWIKSINNELTIITTRVNNELDNVIKENNPYLNNQALIKAKQRLVTLVNKAKDEDDKANLIELIDNFVKGLRRKAIIIEETSKFLSKKGIEINKEELSNKIISKNISETYQIIRSNMSTINEDEINQFIKKVQSKKIRLKKHLDKIIDKIMRNIKPEPEISQGLLKELVIIENPIDKINELDEIVNNNKILTPMSFKELIKKDNIELKDYNAIINYLKLRKAEPISITLTNPTQIEELIINGDRIITDDEARGLKQLRQH